MIPYAQKKIKMINPVTGTKVVTTGNHGDKTTRYQFEAHRILEDGSINEEPEWFQKMAFYILNEESKI